MCYKYMTSEYDSLTYIEAKSSEWNSTSRVCEVSQVINKNKLSLAYNPKQNLHLIRIWTGFTIVSTYACSILHYLFLSWVLRTLYHTKYWNASQIVLLLLSIPGRYGDSHTWGHSWRLKVCLLSISLCPLMFLDHFSIFSYKNGYIVALGLLKVALQYISRFGHIPLNYFGREPMMTFVEKAHLCEIKNPALQIQKISINEGLMICKPWWNSEFKSSQQIFETCHAQNRSSSQQTCLDLSICWDEGEETIRIRRARNKSDNLP